MRRYHSVYDIEFCNSDIGNREKLKVLILEIAEAVGMHVMAGPFVAEGGHVEPGVTAVAIIDLSHISVHTFTTRKEAFVDVFSIKEFNSDAAEKLIRKAFGTPETVVRHRRV